MHMRETRWIPNNRISCERNTSLQIRIYTRPPTPIQHLRNHLPFRLYIPRHQTTHTRYQSRVLNHIRHQIRRISTDRIKLKARLPYKVFKNIVRRDSYSVAMFLELVADGDEWLDVPAATDNLDDDIEPGDSAIYLLVCRWRICWNSWLVAGRWYQLR